MLKTLKKVLSIHELFLVIYATLYEHFIKQKFGPKYKVYFNMETEVCSVGWLRVLRYNAMRTL